MIKVFTCMWLSIISMNLWGQNTLGVIMNSEHAYNGYTLFGNNEVTYLIDNCGSVINHWVSEYKTGHGMYLLENGDLLRAGRAEGHLNAGGAGGIFELFDWDGTKKWSYSINDEKQRAHHDIAPLPNGNFLATVWEVYTEEEAKSKGRIFDGEVWSEKIVEISPRNTNEADIVWEWKVWDHLIQDNRPTLPNFASISDHPERININFIGSGETTGNWLHMNSIDYNSQLDQILVSNRLWSEIWIIDHSTTIEEAKGNSGGRYNRGGDLLYRYGNPLCYGLGSEDSQMLFGQHDARWIPPQLDYSGNIMIYNNEYIHGSQSRVEIIVPPITENGSYKINQDGTYGPARIIDSIEIAGLYSDILSSAQMLGNGNVLICEGRDGRFVEVNEDLEIVWEYINPVNRNGEAGIDGAEPRMNMTWRAFRYPLNYIGFEGRELTPGNPVEKSPADFECSLNNTTSTFSSFLNHAPVKLKNSLVRNSVILDSEVSTDITSQIIDVNGQTMLNIHIYNGINNINADVLKPGLYFIILNYNYKLTTMKFMKI